MVKRKCSVCGDDSKISIKNMLLVDEFQKPVLSCGNYIYNFCSLECMVIWLESQILNNKQN